MATACE